MNKFYILIGFFFFISCDSVDKERVLANPDNGIILVMQDRLRAASTSNRYSIYWDKKGKKNIEIFNSNGGTSPEIIWVDPHNAFICTAYQNHYFIKSHLNWPNNDICFHYINDNTENVCKNIEIKKEQYNLCSDNSNREQ